MPALYKTTVIIWSPFNPSQTELSDLARDAETGGSFCSHQKNRQGAATKQG